jgi:ABC-type transport system substrate-binding protein
MRYIASRYCAAARLIVATALTMFAGCACDYAGAATQPRYGGTLVVELHAPTLVLDPVKWKAGAPEYATSAQIASAVFDRLVTLDRFGRFQPALATEWSHDANSRRWQFSLRSGVQFSDGSTLTSADVAAALQELLPGKPAVTATGMHVAVQFPAAVTDLLGQLASGRYFIYRRNADGTLLGTGPFVVAEFAPATTGARYKLIAHERCWAGRPFVDGIEVRLGVPALRQLFDLQLGKADVAEIGPDLVRRAAQENVRVWVSAPVLLYALLVNGEVGATEKPVKANVLEPASAKAELGEALSLALDRATMANVLLQKQADPAASFLPQWLSGYAFVFGMDNNVERAKEISMQLFGGAAAPNSSMAQPLRLRADGGGDLTKLIAERVAINARQAGIPVQMQTRAAAGSTDATGLRLVAWRYSSLSDRAELDAMVSGLQFDSATVESTSEDPEQLYSRERRLISERSLLPLVVLPEYVGLSSAVRDWMPERWGAWHLADLWLDGKKNIVVPAGLPAGAPAGVPVGVQP